MRPPTFRETYMALLEKKKLEEQLAQNLHDLNAITATVERGEKDAFTAEDQQAFDRLWEVKRDIESKLETIKRVDLYKDHAKPVERTGDTITTSYRHNVVTRQDRTDSLRYWAFRQAGLQHLIKPEWAESAQRTGYDKALGLNVRLGQHRPYYEARREQTLADPTEGGVNRNDSLFQGLERNLVTYGKIRQFARVVRTSDGNPLHWSYGDDSANVGALQGTTNVENQAIDNTSVVYSRKEIGSYTYVSGVFPVSYQLLQDAQIDIAADIGDVLGQRLGRITNQHYTEGTGTNQPEGFLMSADPSKEAASAVALTYDELVDYLFSFDERWRSDPSFAFVMNDNTLAYLHKLKDENLRPLFWGQENNMRDGGYLTLLGKPIVVNSYMPDFGSAEPVIAGGAWSKFLIRDVSDVQVLTENAPSTLSVNFYAWMRTDCLLLNPNAIKLFVMQGHSGI